MEPNNETKNFFKLDLGNDMLLSPGRNENNVLLLN